jgi:hypothetical protein
LYYISSRTQSTFWLSRGEGGGTLLLKGMLSYLKALSRTIGGIYWITLEDFDTAQSLTLGTKPPRLNAEPLVIRKGGRRFGDAEDDQDKLNEIAQEMAIMT